ncbi:RidA family protein [Demequina salsinemoris]|uniref:RidA family protein n=1 Tax=Demequina salsinemoris TaxID=577470 RepID=UPI00078489DD|nr:RidA family protein [Demequina salsinemoris]
MVKTINVGDAVAAYSHGKVVGDLVFTSGLTSHDPVTGEVRGTTVSEQTLLALELLASILEAAGSSMADLVQVQVFLDDIDHDFAEFDAAYRSVVPSPFPPRATVGAALPGYKVEMIATAAVTGA